MREAGLLVQSDGRFIRSKDLKFKASKARCEGRADRLAEKLAPEATPSKTNKQPHSEHARVPKAFALIRRDITPADDCVAFYGYELDRRILAEKGLHVVQSWRFKKG